MVPKKIINRKPILKKPSKKPVRKQPVKRKPRGRLTINKKPMIRPTTKQKILKKEAMKKRGPVKKRAVKKIQINKKAIRRPPAKQALIKKTIRRPVKKKNYKKPLRGSITVNISDKSNIERIIARKMRGKSVAIVGNSKSILDKECGEEIDNHNHVVRFNWASTDTITQHTGNRQTFRFCIVKCLKGQRSTKHPKNIIPDYKMYRQFRNVNIIAITANQSYTNNTMRRYASRNKINIKSNNIYSYYLRLNYFNRILSRLKCPYKLKKLPQVGLCATLLICKNKIKPDLYGFDLKYGKTNLGYPWTKVVHKRRSVHHDHSSEFKILRFLNSKKLIKIHQ